MSVDQILNTFGVKLVADLRASLRNKNVVFGGGQESRLGANTTFEIKQGAAGIEFHLLMPPEWYWVNVGRKPGKVSKEGRASIIEWTKKKAILGKFITKNLSDRQALQNAAKAKQYSFSTKKYKKLKKMPTDKAAKALGFMVARKVTIYGYKGNHFLDEVLNDGRMKQLKADIFVEVKKEIIIDFKTN